MLSDRILFIDGEAIVLDKPAGLPVDAPRDGGLSLENHLAGLTFGFHRWPTPVHRLDRDTSGCLLLARNPKAHKRFQAAFEAGHIPGFAHAEGGQLVQETDHYAPVRGARIVLSDDLGPRADMSASWLAQMGWEVYVLDGGFSGALESGPDAAPPPRGPEGRYKRPYEGVDNAAEAMQAYLDWEYGLVDQLARDATHGFYVI